MNIVLSSHDLLELLVERKIKKEGFTLNSDSSMLAVLSLLSEKLSKL